MLGRVLRFIRLPLLLILIYAVARFILGAQGVPYAPRGNAMFSIVGVTLASGFLFGGLSRRIGGFTWPGTLLVGLSLGFWSQILIFTMTWLSYAMGIETSYFRHWDSLNQPEGTMLPMAQAMKLRAPALIIGPIITMIATAIGGALGALAPDPNVR